MCAVETYQFGFPKENRKIVTESPLRFARITDRNFSSRSGVHGAEYTGIMRHPEALLNRHVIWLA